MSSLDPPRRDNNWNRGPLFRHLPDEIAILVDEPYPGVIQTDAERHETLRVQINTWLSDPANQATFGNVPYTDASSNDLAKALRKDLEPDPETMMFLKQMHSPLQTVIRWRPESFSQSPTLTRQPWVTLPGGAGNPPPANGDASPTNRLRTLHFYQIGPDRLSTVRNWMDNGIQNPDAPLLTKEEAIAKVQAEADVRARRVRDLVNLFNRNPGMLTDNAGGASAPPMVSAMPNWLCDATCGGCSCPGSGPVLVDPPPTESGFWGFVFDNSENDELTDLVDAQRRESSSDVVVAVIDTCPTIEVIEAAVVRDSGGRGDQGIKNVLLHHVYRAAKDKADGISPTETFGDITIDDVGEGSLPQDAFTNLDDITIDLRQLGEPFICKPSTSRLQIDDHGLFVAGIIHDIAPKAELHLIRALGSVGVTHTNLLLPILQGLPKLFLDGDANKSKKLVINLSLGWTIPPGEALLKFWMPSAYDVYKTQAKNLTGYDNLTAALDALGPTYGIDTVTRIKAILDGLHAPIQEVMDFLANGDYKDRILMVAAAGNDNHWLEPPVTDARTRPEPRWPARYDQVLGVASIGNDGQDSSSYFSNRGEIKPQTTGNPGQVDNGIAAFGGNVMPHKDGDLGEIDMKPAHHLQVIGGTVNPVDAIIGIYTAEQVMLSGAKNDNGLVFWSGTSFATPVVAGLAADLWNDDASLHPPDIIKKLTTEYCTVTRGAEESRHGKDAIDSAEIQASQVWKRRAITDPLYPDPSSPPYS